MTVATLPWPHGNSVLLLRPLATLLGRLGEDEARFLADVGVSPDAPVDAYVPNVTVDRALDAIAAARGDETFALTLARQAVARPPLGLFGHLVWLSSTLHGALTRAARFYSLVTRRATLALDCGASDDDVTFTQRLVAGAHRGRILSEYMFASFVLRARAAAGDGFRVRSMRFAHAAKSAAPYEDLFQARVTFDGRGVDALTLDRAALDLPLTTADPFTAAALEAQVTHLGAFTAAVHAASPLAARLRDAVQADLVAGRPSLQSIARRLGVAPRALRRQLEEERVSLRALVATAQREHARVRLACGASIKEVAFELGFSEPSAFSRAYKRWTGEPPSSGRQ